MRKIMLLGVVGLSVALVGCSSEPDESEVAGAVKAAIDKANQQTKNLPIKMSTEFISARKISCTPAGEKGRYTCETEVESTLPLLGRQKRITALPLINDNGTWKIVE